jgi:hypothetical protein
MATENLRDNGLVNLSLVRPVTIMMVLLSFIVIGVVALVNIPIELIPARVLAAVHAGRGAVRERDGAGHRGPDHAAARAGAVDHAEARRAERDVAVGPGQPVAGVRVATRT